MRKYWAAKANGECCGRIVGTSQVYCYAQDRMHADKRKRNAAKAGRGTPDVELNEKMASLKGLTEKVLRRTPRTSAAGRRGRKSVGR
jgi:hypothetical protein